MGLFQTSAEQKVNLYQIASLMKQEGLSDIFISSAVEIGLYYEGIYDLFELWANENDTKERNNIIADIQEDIDEYEEQPKKPVRRPYIKYSDLGLIAKDVRGLKEHLKTLVDNWGGISQLSRVTKIPQPSLSRFFNSNSMPRRTTLYKIANALNLSGKRNHH